LSDMHKSHLQQRRIEYRKLRPEKPKRVRLNKKRKRKASNPEMVGAAEILDTTTSVKTESVFPGGENNSTHEPTPTVANDQNEDPDNPQINDPLSDDDENEAMMVDAEMAGMGIGAKLMAKMGWKGGGLGKDESGRLEPVQVVLYGDKVGLGSNTMTQQEYQVVPGDSYQTATKKRMQERWTRIDWNK